MHIYIYINIVKVTNCIVIKGYIYRYQITGDRRSFFGHLCREYGQVENDVYIFSELHITIFYKTQEY